MRGSQIAPQALPELQIPQSSFVVQETFGALRHQPELQDQQSPFVVQETFGALRHQPALQDPQSSFVVQGTFGKFRHHSWAWFGSVAGLVVTLARHA